MKRPFTILYFLTITAVIHAQQEDTLYYDDKWQPCEKSEAEYYRCGIISQSPSMRFTGKVHDHYKDGTKQMEGTYSIKGFKEGPFSFYYPNGKLEAEGNYQNDRMYGFWNFYYPGGQKKEKVYYSPEGETSFIIIEHLDSTGNMTTKGGTGQFETWMIDFPGGRRYKVNGEFDNGARHGTWKYYSHTNGGVRLIYEEIYEQGKLLKAESYSTFRPNSWRKEGTLMMMPVAAKFAATVNFPEEEVAIIPTVTKEISFARSLDTLYFTANWQICEKLFATYYRFGKIVVDSFWHYSGSTSDYYMNDSVQMEGNYSTTGEKDGFFKLFYNNGTLESKGNYSGNHRKGQWEFYYPNGSLRIRMRYAGDGKNFTMLDYIDSTGNILTKDSTGFFNLIVIRSPFGPQYRVEGNFKNGKRSGTWFYYDLSPYLKQDQWTLKEVYENGELQKGREYIYLFQKYDTYRTKRNDLWLTDYGKFINTEKFYKDLKSFQDMGNDADLADYLLEGKMPFYNVGGSSFEESFTGILEKLNSPSVVNFFQEPGKMYNGEVIINVSDSGHIEEIEVKGNLLEKEKEYMLFFFKKFKNIHELIVENVGIDAYHKVYFYTVNFSDFIPKRYQNYFPEKQFIFALIPYDKLQQLMKDFIKKGKKKNNKN